MKPVSLNFFCFMKKTKKSVVGPVEVYQLLGGGNRAANKDLSVSNAIYCLQETILLSGLPTVLYGSVNGFWNDKPLRH